MNAFVILTAALQTGMNANQFNGYLILAYVVMWLIVTVYIVSLALRQRNIEQDIELMEKILQEDEETAV